MTTKRPLCSYGGEIKELAVGDSLIDASGLFEIDVNGALMPKNTVATDPYWELDINGAVMPKVV